MPVLDLEIREQLARYIAGDIRLGAFREWFSPQAWNIDQRADIPTARMVHEIDLVLAEFDHGDWTEEEVKRLFTSLLTENTLIRLNESPWIQKSSTAVAGTRPADSTMYFGVPPLFQSPQIQLSQLSGAERAQ